MEFSIQEIAASVGGQVYGQANLRVSEALPLQDAVADSLTIIDHPKHAPVLATSPAVAAIVPCKIVDELREKLPQTLIAVDDVHQSFIQAIVLIRRKRDPVYAGLDSRAAIHPTAQLGHDVYVGPGATIGSGCTIGPRCRIHSGVHIMKGCVLDEDCELFPGSVLYPDTVVGKRVTVHANTVIGAYGFGYRTVEGKHERTAQHGWVILEDDVEIGANSAVDRGTYGPTRIGIGTKIDNLVQIGHNNHIGQHNLFCAQVGIAGSGQTGDYVVLGGQVGIRDHVRIGDKVMAAAQSGIANDIDDGEIVMGTPCLPQRESMQIFFASKKIPELRKQLRDIHLLLEGLQQQIDNRNSHPAAKAA